ncbi:acyltransferase family protein [Actinocorallia herbida]|uniref:acyltransferase family protein n=1 Tax=Actinocorallia herbida TaxID=58109 RepID=UPI000F4BF54C|nr:acyltransferase [Actinocorallia herbida]
MAAPKPARTSTGHLAALDGLRGLGIALVVVIHVAGPTAMLTLPDLQWRILNMFSVGVPIFFVLSGYLLYRPYARAALAGTPSPRTGEYLRRRALRILPAYWVMLPFGMILLNPEDAGDLWLWLKMATLTHNYDLHPEWELGASGPTALGPIWSLSTEVTFYLLLPLFAAGLRRFARGDSRRLLSGIGVLFALSVAETFVVRRLEYLGTIFGQDPMIFLFYNEHLLPRSLMYFAVGMAVAVLAERPNRLSAAVGSSPGIGWVLALCLMALGSTPLVTPLDGAQTADQYTVFIVLAVVISAAVVAPAALAPEQPLTRLLLANPAMRQLGLISYGLLLWHSLVIDGWYRLTGRDMYRLDFWLVLFVTVLFGLMLALLSHVFVEQPAQRLARRRRQEQHREQDAQDRRDLLGERPVEDGEAARVEVGGQDEGPGREAREGDEKGVGEPARS